MKIVAQISANYAESSLAPENKQKNKKLGGLAIVFQDSWNPS